MLKIPRFISEKFLVTGLNDSLSVLIFHIEPSLLSLVSDPRSKLTNFGNISDDGNDFNVDEFHTNLVNQNP